MEKIPLDRQTHQTAPRLALSPPPPAPQNTQYAVLGQNLLDDVTGLLEGLWAMASSQDVIAGFWCYAALLVSFLFCCWAGLGWGVFVLITYLLRPPFVRGVPGVWGFRAFFANLPHRSADDFI